MVTVIFIYCLIGQPGVDESREIFPSLVAAQAAINTFMANKPTNADIHRAWIEA